MDSSTPTDAQRLAHLVDVWYDEAGRVVELLRSLDPADWDLPTDLPGWDVRAVAAHLAHLESELAGRPQPQVEIGEAPHIKGLMGQFTEAGPVARRTWPVADIIDELEGSVAERYAALQAEPPTDAAAPGSGFAGLVGWSTETLLRNRPFDLWMHEQDIRRAVDRPGGLDSPGAAHAAQVIAGSVPYIWGKKVQAPAGASVTVEVTGPSAHTVSAVVGENGRGTSLPEAPANPTARITVGFEDWMVLSGGRRGLTDVEAVCAGDLDLAERFLAAAAVTP